MAEQVKSAAPATREVRAAPAKTRRKPVIIEIIGGLLTAAAILFAVNGGMLFTRNATLSLVAPAEIADAAQTLDPAVSGQLAEQAKECRAPLAYVTVSKTGHETAGTIRIHSGGYVSPAIKLTDAPQRVAIPFPAPYPTGQGTISIEGDANGVLISLSPNWYIDTLHGSAIQEVVWTPSNPCQ